MESNEKFCKFCGEKIPLEAVICTKCGRQVEELKRSNDDDRTIIINNSSSSSSSSNVVAPTLTGKVKNKWVTFFLCLFLGGIGGHKFYQGKIGVGIIYLLFCWTYIPAIISFFELFVILSKPTEYIV